MRFIATAFLLLFSSQSFGMLRQLARVGTLALARSNLRPNMRQLPKRPLEVFALQARGFTTNTKKGQTQKKADITVQLQIMNLREQLQNTRAEKTTAITTAMVIQSALLSAIEKTIKNATSIIQNIKKKLFEDIKKLDIKIRSQEKELEDLEIEEPKQGLIEYEERYLQRSKRYYQDWLDKEKINKFEQQLNKFEQQLNKFEQQLKKEEKDLD